MEVTPGGLRVPCSGGRIATFSSSSRAIPWQVSGPRHEVSPGSHREASAGAACPALRATPRAGAAAPVPAERAAAPGRGVTGRESGEQTLWIETCLEPTGRPACKEAPRTTGRPQNVPRERTTEPRVPQGGLRTCLVSGRQSHTLFLVGAKGLRDRRTNSGARLCGVGTSLRPPAGCVTCSWLPSLSVPPQPPVRWGSREPGPEGCWEGRAAA